jgi:hypothetical protein
MEGIKGRHKRMKRKEVIKKEIKERTNGKLRMKARTEGGHALAQTASRCVPTAAARVQTRVSSCGICGGQNGAWAGFL